MLIRPIVPFQYALYPSNKSLLVTLRRSSRGERRVLRDVLACSRSSARATPLAAASLFAHLTALGRHAWDVLLHLAYLTADHSPSHTDLPAVPTHGAQTPQARGKTLASSPDPSWGTQLCPIPHHQGQPSTRSRRGTLKTHGQVAVQEMALFRATDTSKESQETNTCVVMTKCARVTPKWGLQLGN